MRILCLAVLLGGLPQLLKKFDAEVRGLQACGAEVHAFVLGPQQPDSSGQYVFRYIVAPFHRATYMRMAESIAEEIVPDVIYFRYPAATQALYHFVSRHNNIVFEHNTIEEAELLRQEKIDECRWGARVVARAAGICGVTQEIVSYEQQRAQTTLPSMVLGNGIEPAEFAPLHFQRDPDAWHVLCAAHFSYWHGIDRLLRGMARYTGKKPFILHLAGDGPCLQEYGELVQELGIADRVVFHGKLGREALTRVAAQCHAGVGALGIHRKALKQQAALKHREYCLQGLPFFFSGEDVDFSPAPPFTLVLPGDETPVDVGKIADFLETLADRNLPVSMRAYAEQHLGWETKTQQLHTFLQQVATERQSSMETATESEHGLLSPVVALPSASEMLRAQMASVQQSCVAAGEWCREVVVVGDASALRMAFSCWQEHASSAVPELRCVEVSEQEVWWKSLNAGMAQAAGRWLLPLLPGDRLKDSLLRAPDMLRRHQPEISLITAKAHDPDGKEWLPQHFVHGRLDMECPQGISLWRKSLWHTAGPYTDTHPLGLHEWHVWIRALEAGMLVRSLPRIGVIRHMPQAIQLDPLLEMVGMAMFVSMYDSIFPVEDVLQAHARLARPPFLERATLTLLARYPDLGWYHLYLGLCAEGKGDLARAEVCYMQACQRLPRNWQAYLRLALLQKHKKQLQAMELYWQKAVDCRAEVELWRTAFDASSARAL